MAAWPPVTPPAPSSSDKRSVNWNFLSGTSMACPHVTGVVALIKSAHPDWSPAAIKSAIMTTGKKKLNDFSDISSRFFSFVRSCTMISDVVISYIKKPIPNLSVRIENLFCPACNSMDMMRTLCQHRVIPLMRIF